MLIQSKAIFVVMKDASFALSISLSAVLFALNVAKDVKRNFKEINKSAQTKELRSHIMEQLLKSIGLYSYLKR